MDRLLTTSLLIFFSVIFIFPLKAQYAELEILGRRNTPFTLVINGVVQNSIPQTHVVAEKLKPELSEVIIIFQDSLNMSVVDTLMPEKDFRYAYSIVSSSATGDNYFIRLRDRFRKTLASEKDLNYRYFELRYLEKVLINQSNDNDIPDTLDRKSDDPTVVFSDDYSFERDSIRRVGITKIRDHRLDEDPGLPDDTITITYDTKDKADEVFSAGQHKELLSKLKQLRFEEDRNRHTIDAIQNSTLTSQQLYEILLKFDFERSKLQLCKRFFNQIIDPENIDIIYNAFEFNSSKDELKEWIDGQR